MTTITGTVATTEDVDINSATPKNNFNEAKDTLKSLYIGPITAEVVDSTHIFVNSYNDGIISFPDYKTTTTPAISDACRYILNKVGLISGKFPAKQYKMNIIAGNRVVFVVSSIYYGSKNTQLPDMSDIEVTRGINFIGQFI